MGETFRLSSEARGRRWVPAGVQEVAPFLRLFTPCFVRSRPVRGLPTCRTTASDARSLCERMLAESPYLADRVVSCGSAIVGPCHPARGPEIYGRRQGR